MSVGACNRNPCSRKDCTCDGLPPGRPSGLPWRRPASTTLAVASCKQPVVLLAAQNKREGDVSAADEESVDAGSGGGLVDAFDRAGLFHDRDCTHVIVGRIVVRLHFRPAEARKVCSRPAASVRRRPVAPLRLASPAPFDGAFERDRRMLDLDPQKVESQSRVMPDDTLTPGKMAIVAWSEMIIPAPLSTTIPTRGPELPCWARSSHR
jgi:hypothetical protein